MQKLYSIDAIVDDSFVLFKSQKRKLIKKSYFSNFNFTKEIQYVTINCNKTKFKSKFSYWFNDHKKTWKPTKYCSL